MVDTQATCTLDEFRKDAPAHLERLAAAGGTETLTVDGEAMGVVMATVVFDELMQRIEALETTASIRRGLADVAAGRTHDAREAIAAMIAGLRAPSASTNG